MISMCFLEVWKVLHGCLWNYSCSNSWSWRPIINRGSWEVKCSLHSVYFCTFETSRSLTLAYLSTVHFLGSALARVEFERYKSEKFHHFFRTREKNVSGFCCVICIYMLAAFRANWRDAKSLRRRLCHIATIQGTMLLGVATPGRQRGVVRWNPTNRRAVPEDFRSGRSAAEWVWFCHSSFQCECRASSTT